MNNGLMSRKLWILALAADKILISKIRGSSQSHLPVAAIPLTLVGLSCRVAMVYP